MSAITDMLKRHDTELKELKRDFAIVKSQVFELMRNNNKRKHRWLGHNSRVLEIKDFVKKEGEVCANDVVREIKISKTSASHFLKNLCDRGFIEISRIENRVKFYRVKSNANHC